MSSVKNIRTRSAGRMVSRLPTMWEQENEQERPDRFGFTPRNYLFFELCIMIVVVLWALARIGHVV